MWPYSYYDLSYCIRENVSELCCMTLVSYTDLPLGSIRISLWNEIAVTLPVVRLRSPLVNQFATVSSQSMF